MSSKNIIGSINTRIYSDIRGVDYSDKEINISRSPDMLNMWRNYANLGKSIETRPELEKVIETSENVYGIFFYRVNNVDHFIIHSGTSLYDYNFDTGVKTCIKQNGMNPRRSFSFIYNNILYIKDGINYLEYNGVTVSEVVGYIPTTSISKAPSGGGTPHEEYNILTGLRKMLKRLLVQELEFGLMMLKLLQDLLLIQQMEQLYLLLHLKPHLQMDKITLSYNLKVQLLVIEIL